MIESNRVFVSGTNSLYIFVAIQVENNDKEEKNWNEEMKIIRLQNNSVHEEEKKYCVKTTEEELLFILDRAQYNRFL